MGRDDRTRTYFRGVTGLSNEACGAARGYGETQGHKVSIKSDRGGAWHWFMKAYTTGSRGDSRLMWLMTGGSCRENGQCVKRGLAEVTSLAQKLDSQEDWSSTRWRNSRCPLFPPRLDCLFCRQDQFQSWWCVSGSEILSSSRKQGCPTPLTVGLKTMSYCRTQTCWGPLLRICCPTAPS